MESNDQKPRVSPWKSFLINLSLVIMLFISALLTGIYMNGQKAIEMELIGRGRSLFNSIVLTRKWNAMHGGVFVEKTKGMQSNPYLKNPDFESADGKIYTKKNPALMTREISELASEESAFQFHITSLKPINPKNIPDMFERDALQSFEHGKKEHHIKENNNGSTYYRYIAPLFTEESCLQCHGEYGYKVGNVRGGISVTFNVDDAERAYRLNNMLVVALFILTAVAFLGVVFRLIISFHRKIERAEAKIRKMAVTDFLTGLKNRRFIIDQLSKELSRGARYKRPVSCVIFDIDYFKKVNDSYGHDAGDKVLVSIGELVEFQCREIDTLGRYGGEEFLLVFPETEIESAEHVANRIRSSIENLKISITETEEISVTASFGISYFNPELGDKVPEVDQLIKLADEALYKAKENGRNRVETSA